MQKPKYGKQLHLSVANSCSLNNLQFSESVSPCVFSQLWPHCCPSLSAGSGPALWRPQKNRSRAASGGAALASPGPGSGSGPQAGSAGKERSENLSLRRSVSELSLQGRRRRQQERRQQALSMAPGAADAQIGPTDPGDFDQLTQCLIQAPSNRPYFLLLQGYQDAQVSTASPTERALCSTLR